jgi:hypothetical protein
MLERPFKEDEDIVVGDQHCFADLSAFPLSIGDSITIKGG